MLLCNSSALPSRPLATMQQLYACSINDYASCANLSWPSDTIWDSCYFCSNSCRNPSLPRQSRSYTIASAVLCVQYLRLLGAVGSLTAPIHQPDLLTLAHTLLHPSSRRTSLCLCFSGVCHPSPHGLAGFGLSAALLLILGSPTCKSQHATAASAGSAAAEVSDCKCSSALPAAATVSGEGRGGGCRPDPPSATQRLTHACVRRRSRIPASRGQQQQRLPHVPHGQQQQQRQPPSWVCKSSAAAAGGGGDAGKPSSAGPVMFSPLEQKLGALCKNLTNLFPL